MSHVTERQRFVWLQMGTSIRQSQSYLASKRFEVTSVEVLWQDLFGKGIGRKEYQETTTPFYNSGIFLHDKHIVQTSDKLVEPQRGC